MDLKLSMVTERSHFKECNLQISVKKNMKEIGKMILCMVMECTNSHQEQYILVNGLKENNMDKAQCNIQMDLSIQDNGIPI